MEEWFPSHSLVNSFSKNNNHQKLRLSATVASVYHPLNTFFSASLKNVTF